MHSWLKQLATLACTFNGYAPCMYTVPYLGLLHGRVGMHQFIPLKDDINIFMCFHPPPLPPAPSRLMQHIRYRHVESRPHECPLCHKTYKTTHTLVDHLETHTEKCYTCTEPNCFYIATTARNFNHHMRSVHGGELLLYCCHVCNERFSLGRKLTKHLKDQHGFELPPGHSRFRYGIVEYGGNDGDVGKWGVGKGHCRFIYLSILRILVRDFSRNFSRGGEGWS